MSSSPNRSSKSSQPTASNQAVDSPVSSADIDPLPASEAADSAVDASAVGESHSSIDTTVPVPPARPGADPVLVPEDTSSQPAVLRQQPIPPPSESKQYRAIGLIRGKYIASDEQFTRGTLIASDGTPIDAVLLGRVMSLVKKHLDLDQEHLWVVYPRTREKDNLLHAQIVGVWEPEKLHKGTSTSEEEAPPEEPSSSFANQMAEPEFEDGYFSIRGEVIFQAPDGDHVVVKIRQAPRKESDQEKAFKLQLQGTLNNKAVGHFWNLHVQRQANTLVIQSGDSIGILPPRKNPKKFQKDGPRRSPSGPRKPMGQRPMRSGTGGRPAAASPPPLPRKEPLPKPVKRKPAGEAEA